jgi:thiamine kinase-like enzyme
MEDSMIPHEKSPAVTRGLREAFGVTEFEDIRMMTKGHTTALVFRVVVKGTPYLLRMITRTDLAIGPARQFGCVKAAAETGLAPRVWYTSLEDQISITDFVEEVPFPVADALVQMPRTLRALHALAPFPVVENHFNTTCTFLLRKGPALDGLLKMCQATNILSPGEREEFFARYAEMAAIYPSGDADMVSSHNDLFKPDNILFDGQHVRLVDWEAACLNDRYADLAVVANMIVSNEEEEELYLGEYFGQPPDEYQRARFFLMRQVAHVFYTMAFLLMGSTGKPVSLNEDEPELRDFRRRYWAGEINLVDKMKAVYGRYNLEQLLKNTRETRFQEALRIVSDRHPEP